MSIGQSGHRLHGGGDNYVAAARGGGGVTTMNGDAHAHDLSATPSLISGGTGDGSPSLSKSTSGDDMPHALSKVSASSSVKVTHIIH